MAKNLTLRCPSCKGTFDWMRHPSTEPLPRYCPLCSYDTASEEFPQAIVSPHVSDGFGKRMLKSAESVYRQTEAGSAYRAQVAADMAGVPVSEMSSLKVTNFETQLREGDLAVKPVSNPVTHFMQHNPKAVAQVQQNAAAYAAAAHAGPDAHAGARAMSLIRSKHQESGLGASAPPTLETYNRGSGLTF